ncbi:PHP domain-containing protein [Kineococcus gypseus]|uniref:PHP domain-containing protein n=1 Tax=Kineococcus gypseus TaxID=1637102 RepID=UPI003D7E6CC4
MHPDRHLQSPDDVEGPGTRTPPHTDRRTLLRGAGLVSAGLVGGLPAVRATAASAAPARREPAGGYVWLAGDHHVHTRYSNDAMFRVDDQATRAATYGLDWIAITDHGNVPFATHSIEPLHAEIDAVRRKFGDDLLVFLGLEWNIPGAEHTSLLLAPGPREAEVLQEFVDRYDALVVGARDGTPQNEALAREALTWLAGAVRGRRVADALVLPNHPARKGIDSPAELRGWQDAAPDLVIGFEGAPGHQAAGLPEPGMARGRGLYDSSPGTYSFPGYPAESYRTWGGFDWMTATVGGVWDSLLAEGRRWWITTTSDGHQGCGDWVKNPVDPLDESGYADTPYDAAGNTFNTTGVYPPPVDAGRPVTEYSSFPPGVYNKTWVGARSRDPLDVMEAMRAGRMWVCFGDLVSGLDVRVQPLRQGRRAASMGGTLEVRAGEEVEVVVSVELTDGVNHAGLVPELARVDLVVGAVTGPAADRQAVRAPGTRVVTSWDTTGRSGTVELRHTVRADGPLYVRVRGTDGKRGQVGFHGADVDPHGPAIDVPGQVNPWEDLWFYSNPVFVSTTGR